MPSVASLIQSGGLLLITVIIFAESGLLVGFFLPGDTLLFTAGFFAAQHKLPLGWLLILILLAAIAGYESGYYIGRRFGKRLFSKKDGLIFRQEYLRSSEEFYKKHGGKTVLLSRFVPVVRTFAPIVAGIGNMPQKKFTTYNVVGGAVWTLGVTLLGFWLGHRIPNIDHYLLPVILLATELSRRPTGRTLYILDEPTTGLHMADVDKLLQVLHALVDNGNSMIVIEHNLDVIKNADHIIDMGPEGGNAGGTIVAQGTPEQVSKVNTSYTGQYLKKML